MTLDKDRVDTHPPSSEGGASANQSLGETPHIEGTMELGPGVPCWQS